jgi:hypothetical protein
MNYQITLFKQTGFNTQNIPDSQALIDSCPQITLSSDDAQCDILQARGLTSLPLRISYDNAKLVDYIRLSNATEKVYYAVEVVPELSSPDVTHFRLTYNPIISNVSSVSQLKFLDGIFERHHTATDNLFEYIEEDPMLIPSKPLGIHYESAFLGKASDASDSIGVVEATVPLTEIGNTSTTPEATAYTVTGSGESCVVPKLPKLVSRSSADMYNYPGGSPQLVISPATKYYNIGNTAVQEGLARVRDLGIENGSIISQYIVPKEYANAPSYDPSDNGMITVLHGKYDTKTDLSANFNFEYGTGIHNKRVYAGTCNKYGLLAIGSGNSVEFEPEDIKDGTKPSVSVISDPRPDGKPYFRYTKYKNDTTNFFMNCIAGLNWQNIPLLYTDKSGSEIDVAKFHTSQYFSDEMFKMQTENVKVNTQNETLRNAMSLWGAASGVGTAYAMNSGGTASDMMARNSAKMGALGSIVGIGVDTLTGLKSDMNTLDHLNRAHFADLVKEAQEFYVSQRIVAPQLMFPRSEGLRDFLGNGCYAYRYYLEPSDLAKFDKILTMFGYKDTQPAPGNEAFLTNRPRFNYVKIAGASVGGTLPTWEREAITNIFSIGVRIWHTLPNTAYYTDGSNDLT